MFRLRPKLNSITTRLIAFGLTLLLLGATGRVLVLSEYLRGDLIKASSAQLETLATYAAQDIAQNLALRETLLGQLSGRVPTELLDNPARLHSWLSEHGTIDPVFSLGLMLLSPQGVPLTGPDTEVEYLPLLWANAGSGSVGSASETVIGKPFVDPSSGALLLPMTATVRDANGQHLAYLVGLSALDRSGFLNPLYSTHAASAAELILILPGDNLSLGADGGSLTLTPLPESGTDRSNTNTEAETLDVAVPVPGSRWELIARLPTVEVYRPQTELRRFILHNTGFLALIALVLLTLGIRYLLGPLRHAAEHADKMTLNEIPLAPLPVVRDDEVGHLTQAFNRVLDKLIESQAELQHMAHRDPLTGLPNRHLLADRMTQALARAQRNQTWVAVLFFDLDRFKPINDRLGHDAGDQALQQVAARLQGALRRVDTLARVGGDEFVILLTDLGQDAKTAIQAVAQKCLDTFDQEFTIKGEPCRLGTSIGIALGDGDCAPDKLLISADQAMYESKLSGCGEIRWSVAEAENLPMLQANLNHEHFD